MKWRLIHTIAVLMLTTTLWAQDLQNFSERDINGTARYVGMCGAMTAVGGDPSSVLDNPAGLGIYRRMEISLTLGDQMDYMRQKGYGREFRNHFSSPQASVILSFQRNDEAYDRGLDGFSFMISFNRVKSLNRTWVAGGLGSSYAQEMANQLDGLPESALQPGDKYDPWNNKDVGILGLMGYYAFLVDPGAQVGAWKRLAYQSVESNMRISETGYVDEFAFHWGGNVRNRWYMGVGLTVGSIAYSKRAQYWEYYRYKNTAAQSDLYSSVSQNGVGVSGAFGVIWRPLRMLRLGCSIHTPVAMSITTRTSGTVTSKILVDSVAAEVPFSPYTARNTYRMPFRMTTGLALQFRQSGLLSFEYDYRHDRDLMDVHTIKIGGEMVFIHNLFINLGYACESPFHKDKIYPLAPGSVRTDPDFRNFKLSHYASCGIGYRGKYLVTQLAYQFRWQQYHLYAHASQYGAYDMQAMTHRIVFTLAWHGTRD
jgi:hypothetical protein